MKREIDVEVYQRASHLLKKITEISRKLDELPENAPLRERLKKEEAEKSAEYKKLLIQIQEDEGALPLF